MKSVLISIQPKWCELIASGKKTIEVRKSAPKLETPFKCYIYCTYRKANENYMLGKRGKVIGDFVCDNIGLAYWTDIDGVEGYLMPCLGSDCLSYEQLCNYGKGDDLYLWHISDLKIYDKPKKLSEFYRPCPEYYSSYEDGCCAEMCIFHKEGYCKQFCLPITKAPQSWGYCEELEK